MSRPFGLKAKDKYTGFEGIYAGHCDYSTGCSQMLLIPQVGADGAYRDSKWFDVDRVEFLEGEAVLLSSNTADGPDAPAPLK